MNSSKIIITALALGFVLVGCGKQSKPAMTDTMSMPASNSAPSSTVQGQGDGQGIVEALNAKDSSVTLDHNSIPGVMDAMTMQYHVQDPSQLTGLAVKDSVTFTLQDRGEGNYLVTAIHKK